MKRKEEQREVRSLNQKSLDRGAGRLEQPMGLQSQRLIFSYKTDRWHLIQTEHTSNDGPIVSKAPPQLATASWHAEGETANVFAAQRANIQHLYDGNEMNIPQQGHLAAQGADCLGFQPPIGQEQEQTEDRLEQDQGQQDLNNLRDNPGYEGPPGLSQETRRSEANKSSTKSRSKSSRKKKKGR
ncbi:MAG: hypothetical protein EZS28_003206 [Streblomastix strix]|uniref:Uncharacterized protein n=1 Tax=Streblomastix strix TaxID=222440 RepID=A0A5J4X1W5_9EUKA|nr:MAG: hypothetical protein EZS28_003206 [Streblomastix strix]